MSVSIQIFLAAHKATEFPQDDGYVPIHVGRALATAPLDIPGDDTGDNISALNPYYCELTALYWAWKNSSADVVGLVHYRRLFVARQRSLLFKGTAIAASSDFDDIGARFDVIIPAPYKFINEATKMPISNEQQYSSCTIGWDLPLAREAVEAVDASYVPYFDFVMRDNTCSVGNMMVGRKAVVDGYCEWLFAVLFMLQEWVPYQTYDTFEARVFGFIAERLLNVWVAKNRRTIRVGFRPIAMCE